LLLHLRAVDVQARLVESFTADGDLSPRPELGIETGHRPVARAFDLGGMIGELADFITNFAKSGRQTGERIGTVTIRNSPDGFATIEHMGFAAHVTFNAHQATPAIVSHLLTPLGDIDGETRPGLSGLADPC
jgi:hypothetical protein